MLSQSLKGIRSLNKHEIFPSSPTLVSSLNISDELKLKYIEARNKLLLNKTSNKIFDNRLRIYQNQDVAFLTQLHKGKGVFNQQRTGKTPTTLVTMRELHQNRNLIFVPKSSVLKWVKEYKKWHGGEVYYTKFWWTKERRIKAYKENKGTLITNHAKANFDYDHLIDSFRNADAIVLDEAHILRNYTNTRSRTKVNQFTKEKKQVYNSASVAIALIRLRKTCNDAYALTGTPSANFTTDIYGILTFLFPDLFTSPYTFQNYYFNISEKKVWGANYTERINLGFKEHKKQELLEFIETFSVQRKRKEVMQWMPKVDYEEIDLEPSKNFIKWNTELMNYFETTNIICENGLSVMLAQRELSVTPLLFDLKEAGPKFEYVADLIKDYPDKPIIVVSQFTMALHLLKEYLNNTRVRLYTGETSPEKRYKLEETYGEDYHILLANIQVIKESVTFSKAEQIILLDSSLTYIDNEQLFDRFLPTTKEEAVNKNDQKITRLLLQESIDYYILLMLNKKQEETSIVNDYIASLSPRRH